MKQEDIYYKAMLARDPRFDGKFFVGVKTTGIYCRPICPAKPKRENVEFFSNHFAAERAGYRPCLRCRPESAPRSPVWIGTSAIVQRAVRMIHHQETIDFDEDRFSELFGVSARHLRRVFRKEMGKTPKQLSFENRLNLARKLVVETGLPMAEIAFASGFSSIRRFNSAFKDRFTKSPTHTRRNKSLKDGGLKVSIPYRPPFDFEGLLSVYRAHQVGHLEWFTASTMHRIVFHNGKVGKIGISNDPRRSKLNIEIDMPDPSAIHWIISRVRNLFDLDSDPVLIANALELDPGLRNILKKNPGVRIPSGWDPFEIAVSAILGQLVSVERSRALVADLIELVGTEVTNPNSKKSGRKTLKLFPTPKQILNGDLSTLKTTSNRRQTLILLSKAVLDGTISLEPTQDMDVFEKSLLKIRGIGPWTASYIALRGLRHTDAFPDTDLILGRALQFHSKEKIAEMSPWRGYVAALLWREYSITLNKSKSVRTSLKETRK